VDEREKPIHFVRYIFEMRWKVIPNVDRFLAIASAKLRDVGNGRCVQGPESVLVERLDPFVEANFNAIQ
jgi:hypothetical protein